MGCSVGPGSRPTPCRSWQSPLAPSAGRGQSCSEATPSMENISIVLHGWADQDRAMRVRDIALAVAVAAIWGVNFVMIHLGLQELPPLLFSTLRFGLAAFPAVLFVGRPSAPWRWVITVALTL